MKRTLIDNSDGAPATPKPPRFSRSVAVLCLVVGLVITNLVSQNQNLHRFTLTSPTDKLAMNIESTEPPSGAPSGSPSTSIIEMDEATRQYHVYRTASMQDRKSKCMISSYGKDGFGHQLEAKLSCMMAAAMLNLTYVHLPMSQMQHGTNPREMEAFFRLNGTVEATGGLLFDDLTMKIERRDPLPSVGRCRRASWFDEDTRTKACDGASSFERKPIPVFTADNCWDFVYCVVAKDNEESRRMEDMWYNGISPIVEPGIRSQPNATSMRDSGSNSVHQIRVVVHYRLGDARRRIQPGELYKQIIHNLQQAAERMSNPPALQFVIHSDGKVDKVTSRIGLTDNDLQHVSVMGRDSKATVTDAIADMIQSDIFIGSTSSLSNAAAWMRHAHRRITNIMPFSIEKLSQGGFGWTVVRFDEDMEGNRTAKMLKPHNDADPWLAILQAAMDKPHAES